MPPALHLTGSRHPRPPARRVAFCDGSTDATWRDGTDLELSHWIPNRTPPAFKADTSTGIVLNALAAGATADVDLVVNNHVDTDGALSLFVLRHPALALAHRGTLEQAAAMGDFHAWGDEPAQRLFQALALRRTRLHAEGADPQDLCLALHALARSTLGEAADPDAALDDPAPGLAALRAAADALDQGRIARSLLSPRLVHYVLPTPLADRDGLPALDQPVRPGALLPPHLRSRHDAQRLQLLSAPGAGGWHHDLCWPGHAWAETVSLWRPPGLQPGDGSNHHVLHHPPLDAAAAELNARESAPGRWQVATTLGPFGALKGRPFPVVLSLVQEGQPAASALAPSSVAAVLLAAGLGRAG
jgi:hypothetical protein